MMVDVLGGVLSGTGPSAGVPQERRPYFNNGTFFLCIDPTVFRQMDDFLDDIELMKGAHQTLLIDTRSQTPPCAAASALLQHVCLLLPCRASHCRTRSTHPQLQI